MVRMVVPCDFQKRGLTLLEDERSNPGPNHQVRGHCLGQPVLCCWELTGVCSASVTQWWVHTRQFAEDAYREDMWHDWAI